MAVAGTNTLTTDKPLVSVLLPVFNGGAHLRAAVLSILRQHYKNLEIVVINDGSTDASLSVLTELARRDRRIRLISRESRGLVATLNEGLHAASGRLVARMDADDIAYPDRIQRQVSAFEACPALCMVAMHADFLFFENRIISRRAPVISQRGLEIRTIFGPFFIHPTVMLNKDILTADNLLYREEYIYAEDFDLWRRITQRHQVKFIREPGLAWRQGHNSIRRRHFATQCLIHAQIVGEQLEARRIISSWQSFPQSIREGDLDGAIAVVGAARQHAVSSGADRGEFEDAMVEFVPWLFSALALKHSPFDIYTRMCKQGLGYLVAPRDRLWAAIARIAPSETAFRIAEAASDAYRYARSMRLDQAVAGFTRDGSDEMTEVSDEGDAELLDGLHRNDRGGKEDRDSHHCRLL